MAHWSLDLLRSETMKMKDFHISDLTGCPYCQAPLNGASSVGHDNAPEKDCWSMCIYCGHLLRFTDNLGLRTVDQAEIDEFKAEAPDIFARMEMIQGLVEDARRRMRAMEN
jgi:hypothetical protein